MRRVREWIAPAVVFAGVFAAIFALTAPAPDVAAPERAPIAAAAPPMLGMPGAAHHDEPDGEIPDSVSSSPAPWSHGHDGAARNGEAHWRKHGSEFHRYRDAEDYETGAENFTHAPPPGTEVKHRSNGDTLLYNSQSNTFAVEDRNGHPRTMFKPDRGRAYWDRQRDD